MKERILKALMALLGFAGYTACSTADMYGCPYPEPPFPAPEYGCPYAEYVFNTEVQDVEDGTPIEGIRVSVVRRTFVPEQPVDTLATALTAADGKATLIYGEYDTFNTHELVADDIDGAENGGEYLSSLVTVSTTEDNYKEGVATHDVTLRLTKK